MVDRLGLRSRLHRMSMGVFRFLPRRRCPGSQGSEHSEEDEFATGKKSFRVKVDEAHLAAPGSVLLVI